MRVLDPEIVGTFIDEVNSHIQLLNEGFLFIAAKIKAGEDPGDKINEVFRSFHSIKGASGLLGFTRINKLTHKAETLLDQVRSRHLEFSEKSLQALFSAVEGLSRLTDELKSGQESLSLEMLLMEIDGAMQKVVESPSLFEEAKSLRIVKSEPSAKPSEFIRVEVHRMEHLTHLTSELGVEKARLKNILRGLATAKEKNEWINRLEEGLQRLDGLSRELSEAAKSLRIGPIGPLFKRFSQVVEDLGKSLGKEISLTLMGEEVEVDRHLLEELSDPLNHLLRNAADHGLELPEVRKKKKKPASGRITLKASDHEGYLVVEITDDGRGMDREIIKKKAIEKGIIKPANAKKLSKRESIELIFHPGFTTAEKITNVSGRGVGMEIVKKRVDLLGGQIEILTEVDIGTTFRLTIPHQSIAKQTFKKTA